MIHEVNKEDIWSVKGANEFGEGVDEETRTVKVNGQTITQSVKNDNKKDVKSSNTPTVAPGGTITLHPGSEFFDEAGLNSTSSVANEDGSYTFTMDDDNPVTIFSDSQPMPTFLDAFGASNEGILRGVPEILPRIWDGVTGLVGEGTDTTGYVREKVDSVFGEGTTNPALERYETKGRDLGAGLGFGGLTKVPAGVKKVKDVVKENTQEVIKKSKEATDTVVKTTKQIEKTKQNQAVKKAEKKDAFNSLNKAIARVKERRAALVKLQSSGKKGANKNKQINQTKKALEEALKAEKVARKELKRADKSIGRLEVKLTDQTRTLKSAKIQAKNPGLDFGGKVMTAYWGGQAGYASLEYLNDSWNSLDEAGKERGVFSFLQDTGTKAATYIANNPFHGVVLYLAARLGLKNFKGIPKGRVSQLLQKLKGTLTGVMNNPYAKLATLGTVGDVNPSLNPKLGDKIFGDSITTDPSSEKTPVFNAEEHTKAMEKLRADSEGGPIANAASKDPKLAQHILANKDRIVADYGSSLARDLFTVATGFLLTGGNVEGGLKLGLSTLGANQEREDERAIKAAKARKEAISADSSRVTSLITNAGKMTEQQFLTAINNLNIPSNQIPALKALYVAKRTDSKMTMAKDARTANRKIVKDIRTKLSIPKDEGRFQEGFTDLARVFEENDLDLTGPNGASYRNLFEKSFNSWRSDYKDWIANDREEWTMNGIELDTKDGFSVQSPAAYYYHSVGLMSKFPNEVIDPKESVKFNISDVATAHAMLSFLYTNDIKKRAQAQVQIRNDWLDNKDGNASAFPNYASYLRYRLGEMFQDRSKLI